MKKLLTIIIINMLLISCSQIKNVPYDEHINFYMQNKFIEILPGSKKDFKKSIKNRVNFNLNKFLLSRTDLDMLNNQIEWIKSYPSINIIIEGYCDKRGTRLYNINLGEKRAIEIKRYMLSKGIKNNRLKTISYGKEKLKLAGNIEEVHKKNRVGIFVIQ